MWCQYVYHGLSLSIVRREIAIVIRHPALNELNPMYITSTNDAICANERL
jgi:hypothetical protein